MRLIWYKSKEWERVPAADYTDEHRKSPMSRPEFLFGKMFFKP